MKKNNEKEIEERAKITSELEKAIKQTQIDIAKNQELIDKLKDNTRLR